MAPVRQCTHIPGARSSDVEPQGRGIEALYGPGELR
jgi:hypothetical protein